MADRTAFVDQTVMYEPDGAERGNCTEASVASILGIPLNEVPDFRANGTEAHKFWSAFRRFIRSRGFEPIMLPGNHCHDVLYLASGPSPRGVNHMVVMKGGELVHDPHPSKAGIGEVETIWLLVPQDAGSFGHLWTKERRALRAEQEARAQAKSVEATAERELEEAAERANRRVDAAELRAHAAESALAETRKRLGEALQQIADGSPDSVSGCYPLPANVARDIASTALLASPHSPLQDRDANRG